MSRRIRQLRAEQRQPVGVIRVLQGGDGGGGRCGFDAQSGVLRFQRAFTGGHAGAEGVEGFVRQMADFPVELAAVGDDIYRAAAADFADVQRGVRHVKMRVKLPFGLQLAHHVFNGRDKARRRMNGRSALPHLAAVRGAAMHDGAQVGDTFLRDDRL